VQSGNRRQQRGRSKLTSVAQTPQRNWTSGSATCDQVKSLLKR